MPGNESALADMTFANYSANCEHDCYQNLDLILYAPMLIRVEAEWGYEFSDHFSDVCFSLHENSNAERADVTRSGN